MGANARSRGNVWSARCRTVADLIRFRLCSSVPSRTVRAPNPVILSAGSQLRPCSGRLRGAKQAISVRASDSQILLNLDPVRETLCRRSPSLFFCYVHVEMLIGRAGWPFGWAFGNVNQGLLHDCVGSLLELWLIFAARKTPWGGWRD